MGHVESTFSEVLNAGYSLTNVIYTFVVLDFEGKLASTSAAKVSYTRSVGDPPGIWKKSGDTISTPCFHTQLSARDTNQLYRVTGFLHDFPTQQVVPFDRSPDEQVLGIVYLASSFGSMYASSLFRVPEAVIWFTNLFAEKRLDDLYITLKEWVVSDTLQMGRGPLVIHPTALITDRFLELGKSQWMNHSNPQGCPITRPATPRGVIIR